jgi:hypothetical protein
LKRSGPANHVPTPGSGTSSLRSSPPEPGVGRGRQEKIAPAGKNFLAICRNNLYFSFR